MEALQTDLDLGPKLNVRQSEPNRVQSEAPPGPQAELETLTQPY